MKFNKKEWSKNYNKTEKGVLFKLFHHRKEISEKKDWKFSITFDDFEKWAYQNNFKSLYDDWVKSNYDKNLKPSVDRIDDYGVYEFSNMQMITYIENMKKGWSCKKSLETSLKNLKRQQYEVVIKKGNYTKIFDSISSVIREHPQLDGRRVSECARGKAKQHKGFQFQKVC